MYNFTREIRRTHKSGIAVAGGGVAGCAAAIAAAREGADVILIEQSGILGGQAGLGIVTPLSSTRSRSGEKFGGLVREICDEVRKYASEYCVAPGHSGDTLAAPHIPDLFDNPPELSMKMPISSPFSYAEVGLSNRSTQICAVKTLRRFGREDSIPHIAYRRRHWGRPGEKTDSLGKIDALSA